MDRLSDDTQSIYSDLSSLENDTDEFGRKLLQHIRDTQRIQNLNSSAQAFRKARPNPRIALTLDNLQRNSTLANEYRSASDGILTRSAPSVASSTASDPPLNLPREWGRKGRNNNDWLKRIRQDDQKQPSRLDGDAIYTHRTTFTGDRSPQREHASPTHTQPPVDTVKQTHSPNRTSPRQASTPPSARQQNNSLDRIREWEEEQDLTSASLLTSTPAARSTAKQTMNSIRQREIQGIEKRGVASSRRQIWEQTSANTSPAQHGPVSPSDAEPAPRRRSVISNKENIPFSKATTDRTPPLVRSKSIQSVGAVDKIIQATVPPAQQRPQFQPRTDSMSLLERLARVSSPSSSPTNKQVLDAEGTKRPEPSEKNNDPVEPAVKDLLVAPRPQTSPRPDETVQSRHKGVKETASSELIAQTPIVTGAWVNTPRPGREITSEVTAATQSTKTITQPRRLTEPSLPTSALAAVLDDMRNNGKISDNDPTLGDSTIASLEDMMDPMTGEPTITLNIPDSVLQNVESNNASVKAQADPDQSQDQSQEDSALTALGKKLDSTRTSIHEASEGLKRVEHQDRPESAAVSSAIQKRTTTAGGVATQSSGQSKHEHKCDGYCDSCGRPTSVFRAAWSEFCSLYIRRDKRAKWGLRLTWLGLACLAFWTWLATESTLWYV